VELVAALQVRGELMRDRLAAGDLGIDGEDLTRTINALRRERSELERLRPASRPAASPLAALLRAAATQDSPEAEAAPEPTSGKYGGLG
jgi:hypothetical protein